LLFSEASARFSILHMTDLEHAPRNQRLKEMIQTSDCCYRVNVLTDLVAQYAYYPFSEIWRDPQDEHVRELFHPSYHEVSTVYIVYCRAAYRAGEIFNGLECDVCFQPKWSESEHMSESDLYLKLACKRHNPKHLIHMNRLYDRLEANRGIIALDQTADY
jgi:hypothetical protein